MANVDYVSAIPINLPYPRPEDGNWPVIASDQEIVGPKVLPLPTSVAVPIPLSSEIDSYTPGISLLRQRPGETICWLPSKCCRMRSLSCVVFEVMVQEALGGCGCG